MIYDTVYSPIEKERIGRMIQQQMMTTRAVGFGQMKRMKEEWSKRMGGRPQKSKCIETNAFENRELGFPK